MIFLVVLSGKTIFLFPENLILFYRRKMKDDLSQKKYMETWYFLQMPRKDGLSKKIALKYDLSCLIIAQKMKFFIKDFFSKCDQIRVSGKMVFFSRKYDIFSLDRNERRSFSRNIWKYTNMILRFYQKNQRWSSSEKIRLEVIDILDRILERVPTILCTFMETFKGVFIYCFPVKKLGNLMYRIEIWLLLQFFWWEIFFSLLLIFFSFYHNKIHPVTNYKDIKNKINKTR